MNATEVDEALETAFPQLAAALNGVIAGRPLNVDLRLHGDRYRGSTQHALHVDLPTSKTLAVRVAPDRVHMGVFEARASKPGTPCVRCFDSRLVSHLSSDEQWAIQNGARVAGNPSAYLTPGAIEAIRLVACFLVERESSATVKAIYSVDLLDQLIEAYEVLADPFCTCCADEPPTLRPRTMPLRATLPAGSGKTRVNSLLSYVLPEKALINPVCGAIGSMVQPGYANPVTAPMFGQYLQRSHERKPVKVSWTGVCTRSADSRIAGMLEALERQAFLQPPSRDRLPLHATYADVADQAMDPALCFAYNDEAYAVPLGLTRYTENLALDWVWGFSLVSRRPRLVPAQLAFFGLSSPDSALLVYNTSSGCALGSCYEEAILAALCEVIERDSFVLGWHRYLSFPKISLASLTDPKTRAILERLDYLGFDISLMDARLDIQLPIVVGVARRRDENVGAMAVGAAASVDPVDAIRAALFEVATGILEMPKLVAEKSEYVRELIADHAKVRDVLDHTLLYSAPEMAEQIRWLDDSAIVRDVQGLYPARFYSERPSDIAEHIQLLIDELGRCGLSEVVVVDLTTSEQRSLGLVTVRVIVPGLAPIDFWHPCNRVEHLPRLSVAPAGLAGCTSATLNPLPHPFP